MPSKPLPDFASQWIQQWKQAAPRLQAIRDEELRQRDGRRRGRDSESSQVPVVFDRYPERNGLVVMQRWWMRRELLRQRQHGEQSGGERASG